MEKIGPPSHGSHSSASLRKGLPAFITFVRGDKR
jgi:hypothetical protein